MTLRYKVVELSPVTDVAIEDALHQWTGAGYTLEGMHFAMRESSKRPAMAFLVFLKERVDEGSERAPGGERDDEAERQ